MSSDDINESEENNVIISDDGIESDIKCDVDENDLIKKDDGNSLSVNLRMISEIENESDLDNDDQSDNDQNINDEKIDPEENSKLDIETNVDNVETIQITESDNQIDTVSSPEFSDDENITMEQTLHQELSEKNKILQYRLMEYLETNKIEFPESDENESYVELLLEYEDIFKSGKTDFEKMNDKIEELDKLNKNQIKKYSDELASLQEQIKNSGKRLVFERSGKTLTNKTINDMVTKLKSKIATLHESRYEYVDAKNSLRNYKSKLQSCNDKGEFVNSGHYEKLKREKQLHEDRINCYNDKLEQLNNKCLEYGQVLTNVKTKINFVENASSQDEDELKEIDAEINRETEKLNKLKLKRVKFAKMSKEKESEYLLDPILLKDYQKCLDTVKDLKKQCDELESVVSLKQAALKYKLDQKEIEIPENVKRVRPRFHSTAVLQRSIDLQ